MRDAQPFPLCFSAQCSLPFTGLCLHAPYVFIAHDCQAVLERLLFSPWLLHTEIAYLPFSLFCFRLPSFTPW